LIVFDLVPAADEAFFLGEEADVVGHRESDAAYQRGIE